MLPDLDSLALFVRAADMGSLTRAAAATCITVPAASRRLAQLEHQFKTALFVRHSRGLELTAAGRRLLQLARQVVGDVHQMRAEMLNYASGEQAVLRVHGNTSAMTQFLPGDVAGFQSHHPQIRIVLEEAWSDEAVRRVRAGEIDVAVAVGGGDVAGLDCTPYRSDQLAAVVRDDDPIGGGTSVAFAELLERDHVGLEGGASLTRLLVAQSAQALRPIALRVQVRSFEAVCRAVQARLGIGVLPLHAARTFAQAMQLRVLPLRDAWAERRMLLCTRGAPERGAPLHTFVAHLAACAVQR